MKQLHTNARFYHHHAIHIRYIVHRTSLSSSFNQDSLSLPSLEYGNSYASFYFKWRLNYYRTTYVPRCLDLFRWTHIVVKDLHFLKVSVSTAHARLSEKKKGLCSGFIFNFHHDKHTLPALKLCIDVRCGPFHSDQGALLLSCCDHSGIVSNVHSLPSLSPTITFTKYIEFTGLKIYRSEPSWWKRHRSSEDNRSRRYSATTTVIINVSCRRKYTYLR